ncbi:MarR family winged helix-turn-helix transcriptional regulator [Arthrobacter sp. N1]|uniref:MarR family winged helix-turn-helix transcriptional regulator n=1 Tax=Arthrobacter sp. N1 TaxID=619291 RepID=UPI003BAF5F9D
MTDSDVNSAATTTTAKAKAEAHAGVDAGGRRTSTQGGSQATIAKALEALDEQVAALLASHRAWFRRHDTQDQGLNASEYAFLYVIHQHTSLRPRDPDLSLHFSSATISQHAIRLERQGLLARTPDPHDGRGRVLTLTPLGAERLAHMRSSYTVFLKNALSSWPTSDIHRVGHFLALMDTPTK